MKQKLVEQIPMVIGKDLNLDLEGDKNRGSVSGSEASAAQDRFRDEFTGMRSAKTIKAAEIQVAANDVQIGPNGLPVTSDAMTNEIFKSRIAPHMHGPMDSANTGADALTGRRPNANAADMEAGLYGPKSPQNAAQYNKILQDFHSVDADVKRELSSHGKTGAEADMMRQSLYFSRNKGQIEQYFGAYGMKIPQSFNQFEQNYGQKAPLALHWAMEQH